MPILQWLTREAGLKEASLVPFRILEEVVSLGYGDKDSENMLIQGDNLDALKAILPYYAGQVKCIFIDPPYNTKTAFKHYDDNVENSTWLTLIYPRIQLLKQLLRQDGIMFVCIDDDQSHYLKVIMDEIFGRKNYIGTFIWEKKEKPSFLSNMGIVTDYILCYACAKQYSPNFCYGTTQIGKKIPLNNAGNSMSILRFPKGSVHFNMPDQVVEAQDMSEKNILARLVDAVTIRDGVNEDEFRIEGEWRYSQSTVDALIKCGEKFSVAKVPFRINHIKSSSAPKKVKNLLALDERHYRMETNETATKESEILFGVEDSFDYPKPEKLVEFFLSICTKQGDLVVDSFLGSGTTAAVAHKMRRQYIGIEMGDHAETHCALRLRKVVDGEQGGISKTVGWQGGGGFRFYRLGEPFFNEKGLISRDVSYKNLAAHIWFSETYKPMPQKKPMGAFLGVHGNTAYVVLHHDVCGTDDLTSVVYRKLRREIDAEAPGVEKVVIYGESCRMGQEKLRMAGVIFKQIPYDVKGH